MTTKIDTKNENMGQNNKHISNPTDPKGTNISRNKVDIHIPNPTDSKRGNISRNKADIHIPNPTDLKNTSETRWTKAHIISPKLYIIKNSSKTKLNIKNKRRHRR